MFTVAILAGGLATRLRPVTEKVPKSLLPVAGRPFIAWQLDYLRMQGASRVVLCIGHLGEQIEAVVGDGAAYGLEVVYSRDGTSLRGTGGALRQALPLVGEAFFVLYGDSFLPIEFGAVQRAFVEADQPALMTVLRNEGRWDTSNVAFGQGRISEYNKRRPTERMAYIDYGLGVLSSSVLASYAPCSTFDLADLYHDLSIRGALAGYEVFTRFYEIGSERGLLAAADFLRKGITR